MAQMFVTREGKFVGKTAIHYKDSPYKKHREKKARNTHNMSNMLFARSHVESIYSMPDFLSTLSEWYQVKHHPGNTEYIVKHICGIIMLWKSFFRGTGLLARVNGKEQFHTGRSWKKTWDWDSDLKSIRITTLNIQPQIKSFRFRQQPQQKLVLKHAFSVGYIKRLNLN